MRIQTWGRRMGGVYEQVYWVHTNRTDLGKQVIITLC